MLGVDNEKIIIFVFLNIISFVSLDLFAQAKKTYSSGGHKFIFEEMTAVKDVIWGFDFLPDGKIIFTERTGKIKIFDPRRRGIFEVKGTPPVWAEGQGGLLDIRVLPTNPKKIYFTYSEPVGKGATTALGMADLEGFELKNFKKIFTAIEANTNQIHFGSRIEFDDKGFLYMTIGDRNDRPKVQDLSFHNGKVIRLKIDGSIPSDNPFVKFKNAKSEIWALGIRSPQGLVRNSETGDLWEVEMGPRGGDEVNIIEPGKNYGWPVITYGREYWGPKIGEGEKKEGMQDPIVYWKPSISPSGSTFYTGSEFPQWKGQMFIGTLSGTHLRRLKIQGRKVIEQDDLLKDLALRIRNVRTGPDGFLYLSTDGGQISRLVPVK